MYLLYSPDFTLIPERNFSKEHLLWSSGRVVDLRPWVRDLLELASWPCAGAQVKDASHQCCTKLYMMKTR